MSGSLVDLFAGSVAANPDGIAVREGDRSLTYLELDERSGALAAGLHAMGLARGGPIGLCVARGVPVLVGMLGILKAGAAYVPLDREYPAARLRYMSADSGACCIVCDDVVPFPTEVPTVRLQELRDAPTYPPNTYTCPSGNDLAYIVYTSGSTGYPKGVMVSHANVTALIASGLEIIDLSASDRWSLVTSYCFDASVWEMWMCLASGATAVAVPSAIARSPADYLALLARSEVTVMHQVPSAFRGVVAAYVKASAPPLRLRYIMLGGEPVDREAVLRFIGVYRGSPPTWVNCYGITETTVISSLKRLETTDLISPGPTPIGKPLAHCDMLLLDDARRPVRRGEVGELWIGGAGVSLGYVNSQRLTEERFVHLARAGRGGRYYRSGDLARQLPNGEYLFHGRIDAQVKVRGVRIELAEIEQRLLEHPRVTDAAVAKIASKAGDMLVAVLVVSPIGAISSGQMRAFLATRLPAVMLPNRVVCVSALPLTPSGKLDREAVASIARHELPARLLARPPDALAAIRARDTPDL